MTESSHPADLPEQPENRLTSPRFDEFREALEVLYIIANMGGRINFAKDWPYAAVYVLGEQLMQFDHEGTPDRELRSELEVQAEQRRIALLESLDMLEEKSAKAGALQVEYVQDFVRSLGRDLALYVYAEKIVDRFIPPPPPLEKEMVVEPEPVAQIETPAEPAYVPPPVISAPSEVVPIATPAAPNLSAIPAPSPAEEEEFVSKIADDPLAIVQPISVTPPLVPPVAPVAPVAQAPSSSPSQVPGTQRPVEIKFIPNEKPKTEEAKPGAVPSDKEPDTKS